MRRVTKGSEQLARERMIAANITPPLCPNCGQAEAHFIPDHLDKNGAQVRGHYTCADDEARSESLPLFDLDAGGVA